ncbi:MAG: hypothetical protein WDO56_28245 [Gammaproteobacteria bacterium]
MKELYWLALMRTKVGLLLPIRSTDPSLQGGCEMKIKLGSYQITGHRPGEPLDEGQRGFVNFPIKISKAAASVRRVGPANGPEAPAVPMHERLVLPGEALEPRAVRSSAELQPNSSLARSAPKPESASPQSNQATAIDQACLPAVETGGELPTLTRAPDLITRLDATADQEELTIHTFGRAPPDVVRFTKKAFDTSGGGGEISVKTAALVQSRDTLVSDGFGPCVPFVAVYPDNVRAILHLATVGSSLERIDLLLNPQTPPRSDETRHTEINLSQRPPTDVYVICRVVRYANQLFHQSAGVVRLVNNAPPDTNVHVVTVEKGTLSVRVRAGQIDICAPDYARAGAG